MTMKAAQTFGWGAVERLAASWCEGAKTEEVVPMLWIVTSPAGAPIGLICKEQWGLAVQRLALLLETEGPEALRAHLLPGA